MRLPKIIVPVLFIAIIISVTGCYYDKEDLLYVSTDCSVTSAKFSIDVNSLIQSKCNIAGCHNASSAAGGVVLVTYAQIYAKTARINQRCIVDKTMPTSGALTTAEIAVLNCWILSGAPNN